MNYRKNSLNAAKSPNSAGMGPVNILLSNLKLSIEAEANGGRVPASLLLETYKVPKRVFCENKKSGNVPVSWFLPIMSV